MNFSSVHNTHADPLSLPIGELCDIKPIPPSSGLDQSKPHDSSTIVSSDQPSSSQEHDLEKGIVAHPPPPESKPNLRAFIIAAVRERPGLPLFLLASCLRIGGSWRVLTSVSHYMDHWFGIDHEREAMAYDAIFNQTAEVGKREEQCIHDGGAKCRQNFDLADDMERSKTDLIRSSNQAKLQEASTRSSQCIASLYESEAALRDLVLSGGMPPFVENHDICTREDREALLAIAGGDVREDQNEIIEVLRQFMHEGETQAEYLKELAIYNRDYFFGRLTLLEADLLAQIGDLAAFSLHGISLVKVTGLDGFNGIIACVSPVDGGPTVCSIPSISASLNLTLYQFEGILEITSEQVRQAVMVIAALVERYDWAVANLEDFIRIFQGIRSILGRPFDLALDSLGGIDLGQFVDIAPGRFFVPDGIEVLDFGDLPSFQPALDDLRDEIQRLREGVRGVADQVTDELKEKVDQLVTNVREAFAGVFEDYDPPAPPGLNSLDLEKISVIFAEKRRESAEQVVNAINRISAGRDKLPETPTLVPPTSKIVFDATSAQVKEAKASLLTLAYPDIPEWVWRMVDILVQYLWVFDIIRVLWVIAHRFRKHWDKTAVPIPHVQMPMTVQQDGKHHGWFLKCLTVLTPDWLIKSFAYGLALLFAAALAGSYYVIFGNFRQGCVQSNSGTYIGRVLVSNYVITPIVIDINQAQDKEAGIVKAHYESKCQSARIGTFSNQTQQEQQLSAIMNEYITNMVASTRLLDCIDSDAFGGFEPGLSTCTIPLDTSLDDSLAMCDWGECVIECNQGTITEDIQQLVIENACIVEEQLHAKLFKFGVLFLMWLSISLLATITEDCPPFLWPSIFGSKTVTMGLERNIETGKIVGQSDDDAAERAMDKATANNRFWNKVRAWCKVVGVLGLIASCITAMVMLSRSGL